MTTADLLDIIDRDPSPVRTIGSLAYISGRPRRTIEEAIQQARLEGHPIITDGGIRVATTFEEWSELVDWLDARMVTQRATVNALTQARDRMAAATRDRAAAAESRAAGQQMALVLA